MRVIAIVNDGVQKRAQDSHSAFKRRAAVRIPGIGETNIEPIKNPMTGEEHRARIVLPDGFEFKEAEMGNTVYCHVGAGDKLAFELKNTYAQFNAFDWSN